MKKKVFIVAFMAIFASCGTSTQDASDSTPATDTAIAVADTVVAVADTLTVENSLKANADSVTH